MKTPSLATVFGHETIQPIATKTSIWKLAALAAGLGLGALSYPVCAAPTSGGDTVRGLYEALLNTMKSARTLGQSGRFAQLAPVIHRSFDIASMRVCRSANRGPA